MCNWQTELKQLLGVSSTGNVLVIHHTFNEIDASNANVRIFSSRKATNREKQEYMEGNDEQRI